MTESNVNIQMRLTSVNEVSFMMSPGKITEEVLPENKTWFLQSDST